jgi:hypothetical protein
MEEGAPAPAPAAPADATDAAAAAAAATPAPPLRPPYAIPPADGRRLLLDALPSEILADEIVARLSRRHLAAVRLSCRALVPVAGAAARRLALRGNDSCDAAQLGFFFASAVEEEQAGAGAGGDFFAAQQQQQLYRSRLPHRQPQPGGGGSVLAGAFPRAATLHLSPASLHEATYALPSFGLTLASPLAASGSLRTIVVRDYLPEDLPSDDPRAAQLGRRTCGMCPAYSTTYDLSGPLATLAMCSPGLRAFRFSTHFVSEAEVAAICRVPPSRTGAASRGARRRSSSSSSSRSSSSSPLRVVELRGTHGLRAGCLSVLARACPRLRVLVLGESNQSATRADSLALARLSRLESLEFGGGDQACLLAGNLVVPLRDRAGPAHVRLIERLLLGSTGGGPSAAAAAPPPLLLQESADTLMIVSTLQAALRLATLRQARLAAGVTAQEYAQLIRDLTASSDDRSSSILIDERIEQLRGGGGRQRPRREDEGGPADAAEAQRLALRALAADLAMPDGSIARCLLPTSVLERSDRRRRRRWLAAARLEEPGGRGAGRRARPVDGQDGTPQRRRPRGADPPPPLLLPAVSAALEEAVLAESGRRGAGGDGGGPWPHAEPDAGTDDNDGGDSCDGGGGSSGDDSEGSSSDDDDYGADEQSAALPPPIAAALAELRNELGLGPRLRRLVLRFDPISPRSVRHLDTLPRFLPGLTSLSLSWRQERLLNVPEPSARAVSLLVEPLRRLRRLRLGFPLAGAHILALADALRCTTLTYLAALRLPGGNDVPAPARRAWLRRWRRELDAGGGGGQEQEQEGGAVLPPPLLLAGPRNDGLSEQTSEAPYGQDIFQYRESDVLVGPAPTGPARDPLSDAARPPETPAARRRRRRRERRRRPTYEEEMDEERMLERDSYRAQPRFSRRERRAWPGLSGGWVPPTRAQWRQAVESAEMDGEGDSEEEGAAPTEPESEGCSSEDERDEARYREQQRRLAAARRAAAAAESRREAAAAAGRGAAAAGDAETGAAATAAPEEDEEEEQDGPATTAPAAAAPAAAPPTTLWPDWTAQGHVNSELFAPPPPPFDPQADLPLPGDAGVAHDEDAISQLHSQLLTVLRLRARLPAPPRPPLPPQAWAASLVRWDAQDVAARTAAAETAAAAAAEAEAGGPPADRLAAAAAPPAREAGSREDRAWVAAARKEVLEYRRLLRAHMRRLRACSRWVFALPSHFPSLRFLELDADGCITAAAVEAIPLASPALEALLLPHAMIGPGQARALASIGARLPRLRRLRVGFCPAPGYGPLLPWRAPIFDPSQKGDAFAESMIDQWRRSANGGGLVMACDQARRGDQPWVAFGALFGAFPLAGEWAKWALQDVVRERQQAYCGWQRRPRGPAPAVDRAHTRRARALDVAAPALGLVAGSGGQPYLPALDHLEVIGPLPAGCLEAVAAWAYPRGLASLTLQANPCRNMRTALRRLASSPLPGSGSPKPPPRLSALVARRCAGLHRLAESSVVAAGLAAGAPLSRVDFDDPCAPPPVRALEQPPTDDDENYDEEGEGDEDDDADKAAAVPGVGEQMEDEEDEDGDGAWGLGEEEEDEDEEEEDEWESGGDGAEQGGNPPTHPMVA